MQVHDAVWKATLLDQELQGNLRKDKDMLLRVPQK